MIHLALALALQTASPTSFDLVCEGQTYTADMPKLDASWNAARMEAHVKSGATQPFTRHYRVDAVAETWCRDGCTEVLPIRAFRPTSMLIDEVNINRTTGRLFGGGVVEGRLVHTEAQCRREEFSGMGGSVF